MKYILKNDLCNFIKLKKGFIITYIILVMLYILLEELSGINTKEHLFKSALGLDFSVNDEWLATIVAFYTMGIYIFISIFLFTKDIKNGVDNLFLRISKSKWILIKITSIFLITLAIKSIMYLLLSLILSINIINTKELFLVFLSDIIYITIVQNIVLIMYILLNKSRYLALTALAIIMLNIKNLVFSIATVNSISNYILLLVSVTILLVYIFKSYYSSVFEEK